MKIRALSTAAALLSFALTVPAAWAQQQPDPELLVLEHNSELIGKPVSDLSDYDQLYSTEALGFTFGSTEDSSLNLVAYSRKSDEVLDVITLRDADGSLYGP